MSLALKASRVTVPNSASVARVTKLKVLTALPVCPLESCDKSTFVKLWIRKNSTTHGKLIIDLVNSHIL